MARLIDKSVILFDVDAKDRDEVITLLADAMDADGRLRDKAAYIKAVKDREDTSSTAVGFSVATPHAKTDAALLTTIGFARLKNEVVWDEEEKASIIFQLAVPTTDRGDRHLQILAALSRKLIHEDFRAALMAAKDESEIIDLVGEV